MRIARIGVVGAGAMGSGIAALAASAGLAKALKSRPAAFMDAARASLVRTGNTDDDLALLSDCAFIVETIIEQSGPKQALFEKLERLARPTAIIASNTSGIPMAVLTKGRSPSFTSRFVGTHFFTPVRYMHLLEIIPTPATSPDVIRWTRSLAARVFGNGVVMCKDQPGFIATRLGMFGMTTAPRLMRQHGLSLDEVDALTGPLLGRPTTAIFRTGDLSGLDIHSHVAAGLGHATGEDFSIPEWVTGLVKAGALGDKTGGGFCKKTPAKATSRRRWPGRSRWT